ncbi:uncharacterized protein LOC115445004 isoform X2 [Manduca sexta]|uniref:uncharacterized protein LOC115445004 isoform X2 n=1 Tax=Manduca sexta TaxID=7130 RepID=UPI00188E6598|nr:uncharacterized protein LOC115445004 isoform X2 [Manduca sexta]
MSYLSTTENVGGIPQNISDASCATQYKMAVEGVSGCSDVNMFIHDNSGDEQTYITQFNDNFYTKFKIDPHELYTFHDSDVVAGEITVSHTEDNYIFDNDMKSKFIESPTKDFDVLAAFTNGDIKEEKKEVISNGHYASVSKPVQTIVKDSKNTHTKVAKSKNVAKDTVRKDSATVRRPSVHSPNAQSPTHCTKNSINSINTNNVKQTSTGKQTGGETFLDVFKREQGLIENLCASIKTEPSAGSIKVPTSPPKKAVSGKAASQSKARRGRGPAVHEALQRIPVQKRAIPVPCGTWHAPGDSLFSCGPLDSKRPTFTYLESSSSEDDNMPEFESGYGEVCVEESAAESRGSRLALRRAALRRHVARAHAALRLTKDHRDDRALTTLIKKQLAGPNSSGQLPTQTLNHLLATRGMNSVLTSQERRRLRESGWSGGESGSGLGPSGSGASGATAWCATERCTARALPCGRHCLAHVTLAGEQRLYAACAAVFAGGARCRQPLLPLHDHTPLCAEHAWKRDNYDKLSRDSRPKKVVRTRVVSGARPPRRAKRRRRAPPRAPALRPLALAPAPSADHSLSEINVCSNSSTYDSSEDTAMGPLSDTEYIASSTNHNDIEVEVGQVPPDDILDPAVLSQIPDEAFTEFFNQAEGGAAFAESSELAAALEAVLDERALHSIDTMHDVFTHAHAHAHAHAHLAANKIQVPESVSLEMSTSAPS